MRKNGVNWIFSLTNDPPAQKRWTLNSNRLRCNKQWAADTGEEGSKRMPGTTAAAHACRLLQPRGTWSEGLAGARVLGVLATARVRGVLGDTPLASAPRLPGSRWIVGPGRGSGSGARHSWTWRTGASPSSSSCHIPDPGPWDRWSVSHQWTSVE